MDTRVRNRYIDACHGKKLIEDEYENVMSCIGFFSHIATNYTYVQSKKISNVIVAAYKDIKHASVKKFTGSVPSQYTSVPIPPIFPTYIKQVKTPSILCSHK